MKIYFTVFFYFFAHYFLCQNSEVRDNSYNTVTIGNQTWMTDNLNVSQFQNGDIIPEAKTNEEWKLAGENRQPAWCYSNESSYVNEKLYNYWAIVDSRGLAPVGWHIPKYSELKVLVDYLGGDQIASQKLKSSVGWEFKSKSTNSSGFNALPIGSRGLDGGFYRFGKVATYWSSETIQDLSYVFIQGIGLTLINPKDKKNEKVYWQNPNAESGHSIRLIKD
jgi:uncharacterized protein (TIGR02145 family)